MENKIIVVNLKMNQTTEEVSKYIKKLSKISHPENLVICPSNIYIPYFLKQKYHVGIQNIFYKSKGNYTGEISPLQITGLGIRYVLVGHSERRLHFKETDSDINKKIKECLKYPIDIILCIGETLEEKNMLKTARVLKRQLINGLRNVNSKELKHIIIAYEPTWLTDTSSIPTKKDIYDTIEYIKNIIKENFDGANIRVLYGGNINEKNCQELKKIDNLSGFVVGSSAKDIDKLEQIIEVAVS